MQKKDKLLKRITGWHTSFRIVYCKDQLGRSLHAHGKVPLHTSTVVDAKHQ